MSTDPLKLRQLPPLEPPTGLWSAIDKDLKHQPTRPGWPIWSAAAAAALVVVLFLNVLISPDPEAEPGLAYQSISPIQAAMAQSADLESELRWRRFGSVSAVDVEFLMLLETELAWLDLRLAEQPEDLSLWHERSELLDAMIGRYAEPVELALWSTDQI